MLNFLDNMDALATYCRVVEGAAPGIVLRPWIVLEGGRQTLMMNGRYSYRPFSDGGTVMVADDEYGDLDTMLDEVGPAFYGMARQLSAEHRP